MSETFNYLADESAADIITTEGGDPIYLFSFTSEDALLYSLNVDWDADGEYDGENEAVYLLKWQSSRGRDSILNRSGSGFRPYEIGRLTIVLDNSTGRFDPRNADGALYGNLKPGRYAEFRIAYPSTDGIGGFTSEDVFTGIIVDLQESGYREQVTLIIEDGWRYLSDWSLVQFPFSTGSSGVINEIRYVILKQVKFVLEATGYYTYPDADSPYPWGMDYVAGSSSTDLPRHVWFEGSAKEAVEMITFGSLGRSWIRKDGVFDFADFRETTDASVITLGQDVLLKDIYLPNPLECVRSNVVLEGLHNFWLPSEKIAELYEPVHIANNGSVIFTLPVGSTDANLGGDMCPRITTITVDVNTAVDGSGTDLTADVTYLITPRVNTIEVQVWLDTLVATTAGYIIQFDIQGELLDSLPYKREFITSSPYMAGSFVLKSDWLSVTVIGQSGGYYQETTITADDRVRLATVGETLKDFLSVVREYPVIKLRGRWYEQFMLELEDKVTLSLPSKGISDDFRLCKIVHRSVVSPQDIETTLYFYPLWDIVEGTGYPEYPLPAST